MGFCNVSARLLMIILSIVFWACAAGCIFLAIELFHFMGPLEGEIVDKVVLLAPGSIMVVLAILLFIIGMIGICGACNESKCLKATFCIVLFLVISIEVGSIVCSIVFKDEVKDGLHKSLESALKKYEEGTPVGEAVDTMQQTLMCCGVEKYTDWATTPWGGAHIGYVPRSCCKDEKSGTCTGSLVSMLTDKINTEGCHQKLYNDIQQYLGIIIAVAVVFGLVQIIGIGCTCALLCQKKREVPYQSLNTEATGYRA